MEPSLQPAPIADDQRFLGHKRRAGALLQFARKVIDAGAGLAVVPSASQDLRCHLCVTAANGKDQNTLLHPQPAFGVEAIRGVEPR